MTISREELLLRVQSFISVTLGRKIQILLNKCAFQQDRLGERSVLGGEGPLSLYFLAIIEFIEDDEAPGADSKYAAVLIDWPNEWPIVAAFNEESRYEDCEPAPCEKVHRASFLSKVQTTGMMQGTRFNVLQFKYPNALETYGIALWEGGSETMTVAIDPRPREVTAV